MKPAPVVFVERLKLGHVIDNFHEKIRISAPFPPSGLAQEVVRYRSGCGPLARILHLADVPEVQVHFWHFVKKLLFVVYDVTNFYLSNSDVSVSYYH